MISAAVGNLAGAAQVIQAQQAVESYRQHGRLMGLEADQLKAILREEIERAHTRPDVKPADALEVARRRALQAACAQEFARA